VVSVAARASAFAALALLGGVGTVYAPVPTFTGVAALFALGLWAFAGGRQPSVARPKLSRGARIKPRGNLVTRLVSGYLLVFWLGLIAPLAAYSPRGSTIPPGMSQGSLSNQVLTVTFGLVGALFLPAAIRRFDKTFQWLVALWVLYLGWAAASLIWSIYPPLTVRNVVAFVLVSVGCFGLGVGFYGSLPNGRDLFLRHVFWASVLSALVILLPLPFRFEQYHLLEPSQRLDIGGNFPAYVTRPVMVVLLVLVATSILGVRRWQKRDWFWVVFLVLPLLALKERGPVMWGLLALGIFYLFYKTSIRERVLQAGTLFIIGVGTYIYYTENVLQTIFGPIVPYLTRGNVEATEKLTGRIPIWQILIEQVGHHPWLGVGFAAFWSPLNIAWLGASNVSAALTSAHNGYLEELLNTGVVGLTILLAFCLGTLTVAHRRARKGDALGWLVFLFMVFYLLLNLTSALTQEYFQPPFVVILIALGLMASGPAADPPALAGSSDPPPQPPAERPMRKMDDKDL
jgi:exopolysaccharide production protein ExoQ